MSTTEEWASAGTLPAPPAQPGDFKPDRIARVSAGQWRPARLDPADESRIEAVFENGVIRPVENEPLVIMKMERPIAAAKVVDGSLEFPWLLTVSTMTDSAQSLPDGHMPGRSRSFWAYVRPLPADGFGGAVYDVGIAITEAFMQNRTTGEPGVGARKLSPFAPYHPGTPQEFTKQYQITFPPLSADDGTDPIPAWIWRAQARRFDVAGDNCWESLSKYPEFDDAIGRPYRNVGGLTAVPLYRRTDGILMCAVGTRHPQYGGPRPQVVARSEMEITRSSGREAGAMALLAGAVAARFKEHDEALARQRAEIEAERQAAREARETHRQEIALIGDQLIEAANDNDLCEQFDRFVEKVNSQITVELPTRAKEYEVEIHITTTLSIPVTASSADAAENSIDSSDVRDALRDHAYGLDSDDWSVGEVNRTD